MAELRQELAEVVDRLLVLAEDMEDIQAAEVTLSPAAVRELRKLSLEAHRRIQG